MIPFAISLALLLYTSFWGILFWGGAAIALIPIFAFAGVQWIFPYLAYASIATPDATSRIPALLVAGAAFVVLPPLMVLLSQATCQGRTSGQRGGERLVDRTCVVLRHVGGSRSRC